MTTLCSRTRCFGVPLDGSKLLKRFKAAVKRADVGQFEDVTGPDGETDREAADALPRSPAYRSERAWRQRESRCGRCRSGWATETSRPRSIDADYSPSHREAELVVARFQRQLGAQMEPTGSDGP